MKQSTGGRRRTKQQKVGIALIVVLAILVVLALALGLWLAGVTMTGRRQTLDEARAWQAERYDLSFYDAAEKTDYTVPSYDGYELHVQLLRCPQASGNYVIISHGYTDNRFGALKYARFYLEQGWNCVIYDLRGHGENAPTFTSYGIREGQDIAALVQDTRSRYPDLIRLGLHGESLGAASTISSLQYRPQVDFAVADCGFSDIENVLRGGFRSAHLPGFVFRLADLGAKLRFGYFLSTMRPIDALKENEVPILFVHGADDGFILPKNSQDMAARTKGYQELHLIAGAGHAESALVAPEEYRSILTEFLNKYSD